MRSEIKTPTSSFFSLFCLFHLALWTLTPYLVRHHLPMDSLEALTWSQHLTWGYDRNPYVNAWLGGLLNTLAPGEDWAIYFTSALLVTVCFYSLWRLARHWLSAEQSFVAIFMLEGLQFFNVSAIELNDNTLLLGLWPLCTWLFFEATQQQKTRYGYWLGFGLTAGLALMSKYNTLLLMLCLLAYTLLHARHVWRHSGPYLALLIIILFGLPNLYWLIQHDWLTFHYTMHSLRTEDQPSIFSSHIKEPMHFAYILLLSFLGPLFLYRVGIDTQQSLRPVSAATRDFLLLITLGPFLLTVLAGAMTGCSLRINWGEPLLSFWGIAFMIWRQPQVTAHTLKRFIIATVSIMLLIASVYSYQLKTAKNGSTANYPGETIAAFAKKYWQQQTPQKSPAYLIGDRFLTGSLLHYGHWPEDTKKPEVYLDGLPAVNPEISLSSVRAQGGLIVWEIKKDDGYPEALRADFPDITQIRIHTFAPGFTLGFARLVAAAPSHQATNPVHPKSAASYHLPQ